MTRGTFSLLLVGAAAGAIATFLIRHSGDLRSRSQESLAIAPSAIGSGLVTSSAATAPVDSTEQYPPEPEARVDVEVIKPLLTREEMAQLLSKGREALDKRIEEVHTNQLLAAGFTQERVDWMRQQLAELQQARERASVENRLQGIRDPFELAYKADETLELRSVLTEEEFIRYRQAIRQPTDVTVTKIYDSYPAQAAGIVPGDHIVRYDGQRVFNYHELNARSVTTANASVVVEVLRNGQSMTFVMPRGELGLRGPIVGGAPIKP